MRFFAMVIMPLCLFFQSEAICQTTSISSDTVLINLTVKDQDGKLIETKVIVEDVFSKKLYNYKSDKYGKVNCVLFTGESYRITIPSSDDSYEYSIPEFSISPLDISFKFSNKARATIPLGIRLLNNSNQKNFTLTSKSATSLHRTTNDTAHLEISPFEEYSLNFKDVSLKNNLISPEAGKARNYIVRFITEEQAELIEVKNTEAVINIIYSNLYGRPNKDEKVVVKGTNSKTEFQLKTLGNGSALAIVPAADEYRISLKHFPNVFHVNLTNETEVIYTNTIRLKFPSSKEFEEQRKNESRRISSRDSLYVKFEKANERKFSSIKDQLESTAVKAFKELLQNPKYFQQENNEVCAVLNRNKDKWKTKMIVTDVTGSMYPYMKEVALWHLLELMNNERSDYIFFNDGDNMPDNLKIIGKTGGIYISLKDVPDSVLSTLDIAMSKGNGGDAPENNIEALLEAQNIRKNSEIILVADNLSPVKDLILLENINIPIRIIVCGSKNGYVHPDYLTIAYRSGGSVHTIEEDIVNLTHLRDDDTITISGKIYRFIQGHFFPVT